MSTRTFACSATTILLLYFNISLFCQQSRIFYDANHGNRMAAEWEPTIGCLIAWPLSIPYKLVIALAADQKIFVLVENVDSKEEASTWFKTWGITEDRVIFIYGPQGIDVSWVRDWGPHAVFDGNGNMKLADPKYVYATPLSGLDCKDSLSFLYMEGDKILRTDVEDRATMPIGASLGIEVLDLPFISTGGNVMTDGLGTAFSSCILTQENRFYGVSENDFFKMNTSLLGIKNYHILPNFEKKGIQHIDCLMKLLDEDRLMVLQPPKDHALYSIYEDIVNHTLSTLKNAYGRPFEILRMSTTRYDKEALAAYSNAIILNKNIYVPLFQIPADSVALSQWRHMMPGYKVQGFVYDLDQEPTLTAQIRQRYHKMGWNYGDALHCRTRAIWDAEMLFITVNRLDEVIDCSPQNKVLATIIDYSKKGIVAEEVLLYWRTKSSPNWQKITMNQSEKPGQFEASLPCQKLGVEVFYFVEAKSNSNTTETKPSTAPKAYYRTVFK